MRRLRRRRSLYSSSSPIENLEAELDHGQKLSLVFKDLSPTSLLPSARRVRPPFLYEPRREIETYRTVLAQQRLGTPLCYGTVDVPEQGRHWLFLERVRGCLLWQVGRIEAWEEAARWLARLHSRGTILAEAAGGSSPSSLLRYDDAFFATWPGRAEQYVRQGTAAARNGKWHRFERLISRYDLLVARLMALPAAFVHGEFYPSNVLVRPGAGAPSVCPVDWEVAGAGPGLLDLAALTSGEWDEGDRRRMVTAYRDALEPARGWAPSLEDLLEAVACCQLHYCMQWLGWASQWKPPDQHAQDWLREALRLAETLGF